MKKQSFIKDTELDVMSNFRGWIRRDKESLYFSDSTREVIVTSYPEGLKKTLLNQRVSIIFDGVLRKEGIQIVKTYFYNVNKIPIETESLYLEKNYLRYIDIKNIDILRQLNKDSFVLEKFLIEHDFIKVSFPTLFKSVREYNMPEFRVNDPISGKEIFSLLQSPEMPMLLTGQGGLIRSYSFARCYRVDEDNNDTLNNAVIEFEQLDITSAFTTISEGVSMIENMLSELHNKNYTTESYSFSEITYAECILKYSTDKPDFRFHKIYTPTFVENGKNKICCVFNALLEPTIIKQIQVMMNNSFPTTEFELFTHNKDLNKNSLRNKMKELNVDESTLLILDENSKNKKIIKVLIKSIYRLIHNESDKYCYLWVTDFPIILKKGDSTNLFTKINSISKCTTYSCDLILNGEEVGSGGERTHSPKDFLEMCKFQNIKNPEEKYGYYLNALNEGSADIFIFGLGWERFMMTLYEKERIQDLQVLSKTGGGHCMITEKKYYEQVISNEND